MTPERVKELLPVFEAYAEGKEIQFRQKDNSDWKDPDTSQYCNKVPTYSFLDGYEYRVKPIPKVYEVWVNAYLNTVTGDLWPSASHYPSKEEAILHKMVYPNHVFAGTHKIEFTYEKED